MAKITQKQLDFCIQVVNVGVFNGVIEQWATIKKNSHNKFGGWVSFRLDEDDEVLYKVEPKDVFKAINLIIDTNTNVEDETEMRVFLSFKRMEPEILEEQDISAILQIASVGDIL